MCSTGNQGSTFGPPLSGALTSCPTRRFLGSWGERRIVRIHLFFTSWKPTRYTATTLGKMKFETIDTKDTTAFLTVPLCSMILS